MKSRAIRRAEYDKRKAKVLKLATYRYTEYLLATHHYSHTQTIESIYKRMIVNEGKWAEYGCSIKGCWCKYNEYKWSKSLRDKRLHTNFELDSKEVE